MAKASIDDYRPRGLWIGEVHFSDASLDAIAEAGGGLPEEKIEHWQSDETGAKLEPVWLDRRTVLSKRLEAAAQWWHVQGDDQTRPTSKQIADRCELIENRAVALLKALGTPDGRLDQMPDALRFGALQAAAATDPEEYPNQPGAERLGNAVDGIERLRRWSRSIKSRNRSKKPIPREKRHAGDKALDELFSELTGIYFDVFKRMPRISVGKTGSQNEGEPVGPFIRYMRACLTPLMGDVTPSDHAIRERWRRRYKSKRKKS